MTAREVVKRIRKVARVQRLDVEERLGKASHRRYIIDGHRSTTVSWHPGDIPDGALNKIEEQLRPAWAAIGYGGEHHGDRHSRLRA